MRVGREPTEDLKRMIVAACQGAGLAVQGRKFYPSRDRNHRVVQVSAHTTTGKFQTSMIGIVALIHINGNWSGTVDVRCAADGNDTDPNCWDISIMRGRSAVPLSELVDHLKKTVEEREQVAVARKMGVRGPYAFGDVSWEESSDIIGR